MIQLLTQAAAAAQSKITLWIASGFLVASLVYTGIRLNVVPTVSIAELSPAQRAELSCGPVSLAIAAQLTGEPVTTDKLLQECRFRPDGVDASELQRLAVAHGLRLSDLKLNWEELLAKSGPVILHFPEGHFVVAHPAETKNSPDRQIRVYDPRSAARYVSQLDLEKAWKGRSFIVEPAGRSRKSSQLAAERWWIDRGTFLKTTTGKTEYELPLRNVGTMPLTLKIDRTSCSCTSATLDDRQLAPGESTWLRAAVALDRKRGPYYEKVWIAAEGSAAPQRWCVTLCGTAVAEVKLSQTTIFLGSIHPGDLLHGSIVIHDRGDQTLEIMDAQVDGESLRGAAQIECRISKIRADLRRADIVRRHPKVVPGDWYVELTGTVAPDANCGQVQGALRIKAVSGGEPIALECPVVGRIESDVDMHPSAVVIRKGTSRCEVSVSRAGHRPVQIRSAVVENLPGVACEEILQTSPSCHVVRLSVDGDAIEGRHQRTGQLRLNLGSDGERLVPLLALCDVPVASDDDSRDQSPDHQ